mgnify:CR=1 FL=1
MLCFIRDPDLWKRTMLAPRIGWRQSSAQVCVCVCSIRLHWLLAVRMTIYSIQLSPAAADTINTSCHHFIANRSTDTRGTLLRAFMGARGVDDAE